MYWEIPQGSKINIQGLECCIPPEGYIYNIATKQLEHIGVYSRSDIPEEQYWERIPLPYWYKDVMKQWDKYDRSKKDSDEEFYNEDLEIFKKQEWSRRLNGFWFMNFNPKKGVSEPVYITGANYLLLQWLMIDIGVPKFRFPDLEYYYFQQYCIEDNNCMGMIEITKRRFGKTYRGGVFLLDYVTRTKNTNGGIQSKTGGDAKKVFAKAVVPVFKSLPKFFKPEYDMSLGITPKTEIRFQQTNVRGKKAEGSLDKDELNSMIDFQSADKVAYDGQKLHRYFGDEFAKTVETDVYERHDVVRYCLLDDEGRIIGKALYSSTVEQLESEKDGVSEAAILLWNDSDQNNKGENGRTPSGLYRFFMSSIRARNFDIYGYPDEAKTEQEIDADRKTVKHNQRAWAARVRKEPKTIDEAFYAGNDRCEYNAENINKQIKWIEDNPGQCYWRQARLVEKKKKTPSIVIGKPAKETREIGFMDDESGGWFILEEPSKPNAFSDRNGYLEPINKIAYQLGIDTTQDRVAVNGSNPAITVFKKSCIINGEETGMYPVALWISPTRLDIHFDDEVRKAAMWYGCEANYEIDRRTDFYRFFCKENCQAFLTWTPKIMMNPLKRNKQIEYGSRSGDPFQLGQMLQISKLYIDGDDNENYNGHVHRVRHIGLLKQGLTYNHLDRTKSDLWVSLQMALVPVFGDMQIPVKIQSGTPKMLLPQYKIKMVS